MTKASITRLKNGAWQVRWRDATGAQKSKCFPKKGLAWELHDALERGDHDKPEKPTVNFAELAFLWLESHAVIETADSSVVARKSIIFTHLIPAFGERSLPDLTKNDLVDFRTRLVTGGLSRSYTNIVVSLARQIMESGVDRDLVTANPWSRVKPIKIPERAFATWTRDECDRFLAYCREADPAFAKIVTFALHTGLRAGELAGLTRSSVDYDRRVVSVTRIYSLTVRGFRERTKGGKLRHVEMNTAALEAIADCQRLPPSSPLFPSLRGRTAAAKLQRLAKRAKVPQIRFHDLRHTFGTLMASAGCDPFRLQEIMGHGQITQTMRYVHLRPALRGETERLVQDLGKTPKARKTNHAAAHA